MFKKYLQRHFALITATLILINIVIPIYTHALDLNDLNPLRPDPDTEPITTIDGFVVLIARWAINIAFPIAAIAIIYAGFLFVTSGGSEEKIRKARKTLLWAVIGTIVVVGAWALASAFQNFLASS